MQLPVGVVFRRLADADGGRTWFGLWDLAADAPGPLGTVAIRWVDPGVVQLCALTAPADAIGDRLLSELADALRADGAERIVATLDGRYELLRRAGFRAAPRCSEVELDL